MDALSSQVRALAGDTDEKGRKKLLDDLRELSYSIETPQDTLQRTIYLPIQLAAARIGCDLKLFNILAESSKPLTVDDIVKKTGAAPTLTGRLLRCLASIGDIAETDKDTFTANNITRALTIEGFQGGIHHYFDTFGPVLQELPDFLIESNYQDITDPTKTPLQKAFKTELSGFAWLHTQPNMFKNFDQYMAVQRMGMPMWLDSYPYREKAKGLDLDRPLFVDVGSGLGHQSVALREALPTIKNRVIAQDLPVTLEHAFKHDGVEIMTHDFWEPQPVQGAKMYYMRNILHDYPDDKAIAILKNIIPALSPDSVILIDEKVVPNKGAHWETTQLDIAMMAGLAALERTQDQWYQLVEKAGLKIVNMYTYTTGQDHIIECVPA